MIIGAMAGSTAGGLKVSRVVMFGKVLRAEILRQREPARIVPVRYNNKALSSLLTRSLFGYLIAYLSIFTSLVLIMSFECPDFTTAFSAVAATFNNIGPGLGAVGPTSNYAWISPWGKLFLSFGMIASRLEIWPMVILFSWRSWKKA
jgi:trk system potassium uptake protein TrkH